jgi:pimeloyl-ACP methyl ester carboxylesterase
MRIDKVISADGATVVVRTIGSGPSVVILHGGAVAERDYRKLAEALSDQFTVHLYNRRGRPDARPLDGSETEATDIADLAAVLAHTGARSIFGHSGGGFVALRAGLSLPLDRIAVYDAGLSILGRPSLAFFDEFQRTVDAGDYARALTVMGRAVHPDGPAAKLPFGVAQLITRAFLQTPIGRRLAELLPTAPPEIRRIHDADGPATDYAGVTADVLLAAGSGSSRYFYQNCEALAAAIPRGRAIIIPRSSHNAANIARKGFVAPFSAFFAGPLATA